MLKSCPDPVDVQDLQFKLHCRLRCFENSELSAFQNPHSLISCASRFGLFFVGSNTNILQVIQTKSLESFSPKDKDVKNYPKRQVSLPSSPRHICANCDSTILAVVVDQDNCPWALFYNVLSFYKQNPIVINKVRLSASPNVHVREINWNPSLPLIFTACKSDGSLGVYELKGESVDINELPSDSGSTTFCWSPKGKQIAVGSKDGKITQYKPDLKAVKVVNKPPLDGPYALISLQWVSNYQFIGVYQSLVPEGSCCVIVVDAPKTGECTYTNYDDVCYSGASRLAQFYMILQAPWNILMIASANSTELGILGNTGDVWTQWIVPDSARAELPLSHDHQETLPIGMAIDTSSTKPLPWGESFIPPCPIILILSHHGVLCLFHVVNLKPVPSICSPPDYISDTSGLSLFVSADMQPVSSVVPQPTNLTFSTPTSSIQPSLTVQQNVLSIPKPTFTNLGSTLNAPLFAQQKQVTSLFEGQSIGGLKQDGVPLLGGQTTMGQKQGISFFGGQSTTGGQTQENQSLGEQHKQRTPVSVGQQSHGQQKHGASLFGEQKQGASLFGGQISLTPVKPQQQLAQKVDVPHCSSVPVPASTENKYSSIFSALNVPPAQTNVVPVKVSPIEITVSNKSQQQPQQVANVAPVVSKPSSEAEPSEITPVLDPKAEAEKEALLKKMIRDECVYLEAELKALLYQGRSIKIDLGTDAEKTEIVQKLESLKEFLKEIIVINAGQSAEIHYLKQSLVQSWAWYEEAKSRYYASKDEAIATLLRSQPLDSAAEKRLKDIQQMKYYIESQLSQASKALDEQWDNFQDYAKKTYRIQTPTMEAIFQTMVRQNAILQKQSYVLKDIALRIRKKNRSTNSNLLVHLDKRGSLADDFKDMSLNAEDICERQYEKILNRTKSLTPNKTSKLRDFLKNRQAITVTTTKPHLSLRPSNAQSPAAATKSTKHMISLLGAQLSPVQKPSAVVRNLDFKQSTPLREFRPDPKPAQTFTVSLAQEKPILANPNKTSAKTGTMVTTSSVSGFTPLVSKSSSIISSNLQGSAFVPATQAKFHAVSAAEMKPIVSFGPAVTSPVATVASKPAVSFAPAVTTSSKFLFSTPSSDVSKPSEVPAAKSLFSFSSVPTSTKSAFSFTGNAVVTKPSQHVTATLAPVSTSVSSSTFSFGAAAAGAPKTTSFASVSSSAVWPAGSTQLFGSSKPAVVTDGSQAQVEDKFSPKVLVTSSGNIFSNFSQPVSGSAAQPPGKQGTSIFSSASTQPVASMFGSTTSTQPPVFGNTAPVFRNVTSSTPLSFTPPTPVTKPSVTAATTPDSTPESLIASATSVPPCTKSSDVTTISTTSTTTTVSFTTAVPDSTVTSSVADSSYIVSSSSTLFSVNPPAVSVPKPSIFGSGTTQLISPTANSSVLSNTSSTVGTNQQTSIFGSVNNTVVTSKPSIFGNMGSSASVTQSPVFGSTPSGTASTATPASIFSSAAINTTVEPVQKSIFGTSGTPASPFGSTTTPSQTSTQSIFGTSTTGVSQPSIFGGTVSTQGPSIFAAATAPATSALPFGTAAFAAQTPVTAAAPFAAQSPVGGAATFAAQTTANASPFGQQSTGSIFAQPPAFGTGGNSVFGGGTTATNTTGSVFGKPAVFGAPTIFGDATTSASPSVFGGTGTGSSTFGTAFSTASSTGGSVFGALATSQPSTFSFSSAANNPPPASGSFGLGSLSVNSGTSGGSIFGGAGGTTTGGSAFGQAPAAQNPFGKAEQSNSPFGGGAASVFGSPAPFGGGNAAGTGTFTPSFGSPLTFGQEQKPAFGQSTFGASTFGSPQPGAFSAGAAAPVGQTGFGSPTNFQKPSGFGSPPTFGGSPAFGTSPSFGGAPAFGAAPAFGSPGKIFGASSPTGITGGFGTTAATPSTGFESLANQNTIGFGNLAQQAAPPNSAPFSGASSFSSWR